MKNDNRGVSLIELIAIISIMSVMIGAGIIGLQFISTKPAYQAAYNMKMAIQNGRTIGLTKEQGGFEILIKADDINGGFLVEEKTIEGGVVNSSTKNIGGKGASAVYYKAGDSTPYPITATDAVEIKYNRSTGGFVDVSGKYIDRIEISKSTKTYKLKLYRLTGKVIME